MDAPYLAEMRLTITSAERIKAMCKAKLPGLLPPTPSTSTLLPTPPTLILPVPQSIATSLLKYGCSTAAARSLSDAFVHFAHEIRASYESMYLQSCKLAATSNTNSNHLSTKFQNLGSKIRHKYRDQLLLAEKRTISKVTTQSTTPKAKPVFNQEYVPLLETYFMYNAYPSAPDRVALAKKSMMTPRQIEVWFQNHRNRTKKEGVALRRLTSDPLPLRLSLESLEKNMPFFVIPEKERTRPKNPNFDKETDKSTEQAVEDLAHFSSVSPPHAFPTTYPPLCDYKPFPALDGQCKFPEPTWMRKPAISLPHVRTADINILVAEFTKLVIMDSTIPGKRQRQSIGHKGARSWLYATHTKVSLAPHPALIRPIKRVSILQLPLLNSAPPPCLRQYRSPRPYGEPASDLIADTKSIPRRVARLPQRIPKNHSLAHRGISPAMSDASPSRSLSSSSRASSFTSDTLLYDRHTSFSSESPTSSTVTTPEHATIPLPYNGPYSIHVDDKRLGIWDWNQTCIRGPLLNEKQTYNFTHTIPTIT